MSRDLSQRCVFETERLRVESWTAASEHDLTSAVAGILTARSTADLPEPWQGDYSTERAAAWIEERNDESPTLLITEIESRRPAGLVMLAEMALDQGGIDVRVGYVFAETAWGRGLGTELLVGLVDWARADPTVSSLTAGADVANRPSVRVLEKAGFEPQHIDASGTATYWLSVANEWDVFTADWDRP